MAKSLLTLALMKTLPLRKKKVPSKRKHLPSRPKLVILMLKTRSIPYGGAGWSLDWEKLVWVHNLHIWRLIWWEAAVHREAYVGDDGQHGEGIPLQVVDVGRPIWPSAEVEITQRMHWNSSWRWSCSDGIFIWVDRLGKCVWINGTWECDLAIRWSIRSV